MGKMKEEFMRLQETPIMDDCPECQGTGTVEYEVARPQSFSRDIGEIDVREETCETCNGGGEMERLCDCLGHGGSHRQDTERCGDQIAQGN